MYARPGGRGEEALLTWRPFQSLYGSSDWSLPLPPGDRVEAIAAGRSFLAVATSQHHLRILTTSGVPLSYTPPPSQKKVPQGLRGKSSRQGLPSFDHPPAPPAHPHHVRRAHPLPPSPPFIMI